MSRIHVYLICIFLLQILNSTNCDGFYSIIAPNTIRPNSQYHVAVSIHKSTEPVTIKLGIIGATYTNFKTAEVRPFSSELVHFEIGELKKDRYSLTAEGITGIIFTNETKLNFETKQFSVLIQTDKAIYKPGDIVRYRILVLDSNLKPARNYGEINVEIRDVGHNIIRSLNDVRLISSIYSDELQLSSFPPLGEWSINVKVMDEKYMKTFEIAEYILPKFEITIDTPRHSVYKDRKIGATIRAKYNFGKPIKGEATISVYPKFFGSLQPFIFDLITRKVLPLDGKAYVEFDIENELKFKEDYQREILIEAIVEEELTGRKQNATTTVTLHRDRYNIETTRIPNYYIPGVSFDATIKVVQHDGSPLRDNTNPITAYLTNSYGGNEIYNKTEYKLDDNGMTKMRFTVPDTDNDEYHEIVVNYLDVSTVVGKVPRKLLHSSTYIHAEVINDSPTINQEVVVTVKSNRRMLYFIYQVVGRGDILLSRAVDVPDSNYHTFKFLANFAMFPKAKLLVYQVIDGELIFDEQTINFGDELLNFVRLETPTSATPGQEVDITITTKPYSYIGLMAVDQNALKIREGNDFNHNLVMNELATYDLNDINSPISSPGRESGVITMTNADYYSIRAHPTRPSLMSTTYQDENKLTTIKKTDIGPAHKFEVNTRPPLAGPYAFSRIPKPFWNRPRVHVMHPVEDTWLFLNVSSGPEGRTTIHKKLPISMESWVLTGFSLDPVTGLGLSRTTKSVQPYKSFYITTLLPFSVKKGEIIAVPLVVTNNMERDLETEVTLYNTAQEFEFPQLNNELEEKPKIELYIRRSLKVPANSVQSLSFMIRPKKLGPITIKAIANSQIAGDTVEKMLLVEPPGSVEYRNHGYFIDLKSRGDFSENVTIDIPKNAVEDSIQIEVSVVGDIFGPAIKNTEKLIRLPVGCGEQNMVNFIPNILVLKYLEKINKLSPAIETKAKMYLDVGYQRELYYRHLNGAFSGFGTSEKNSSTWLTAYVARFFRKASSLIQIDQNVIKSALDYLKSIQAANGSFPEMGDIFEHQDDGLVSLTSFVLLAFLENGNNLPEYRNNINKALDFIVRGLDTTNDIYTLSIASYALSLAKNNAQVAFIQRLDSKAIIKDGKKWWAKQIPESEKRSPWYNHTRSVNIEISSYAALALLENNLIADAIPILKWLVDQRNVLGGFASSQDTVLGLLAITKFAENISSRGNNIQLLISYGQGAEARISVTESNSIVLQTYQLPASTKNLTLMATGYGNALAQISYKYNTNVTGAWPRFVLDPQVNRISHGNYLHLSICTSFVTVEGGANRSNMVVMEVSLPSGFVVDLDTLPSLEANERIRKVETRNGDTVVVIYFDYLEAKEICPTLDAYKIHKVTKHQPVPIIIYDYYDNARKARMFYRAPKSTICDICDGDNCGSLCERAEQRQSRRLGDNTNSVEGRTTDSSGGVITWILPSVECLIIATIITRSLF